MKATRHTKLLKGARNQTNKTIWENFVKAHLFETVSRERLSGLRMSKDGLSCLDESCDHL